MCYRLDRYFRGLPSCGDWNVRPSCSASMRRITRYSHLQLSLVSCYSSAFRWCFSSKLLLRQTRVLCCLHIMWTSCRIWFLASYRTCARSSPPSGYLTRVDHVFSSNDEIRRPIAWIQIIDCDCGFIIYSIDAVVDTGLGSSLHTSVRCFRSASSCR